jgi:hypothetical protein
MAFFRFCGIFAAVLMQMIGGLGVSIPFVEQAKQATQAVDVVCFELVCVNNDGQSFRHFHDGIMQRVLF